MPLAELVRVLQVAISPVVLVSGVGLLILATTNRMAHLVDRIRAIHARIVQTGDEEGVLDAELAVLVKRSGFIRMSLLMFVISILLDAVMVILLFIIHLLRLNLPAVVVLLFSFSLLAMITGLIYFIVDVISSLRALQIDVGK